jgi:hypothetical protein
MALGRYEICYPVDLPELHTVRVSDLDEAGQLLLRTPGATDIFDHDAGRYVNVVDIACVAEQFELMAAEQPEPDTEAWLCPDCGLRRPVSNPSGAMHINHRGGGPLHISYDSDQLHCTEMVRVPLTASEAAERVTRTL